MADNPVRRHAGYAGYTQAPVFSCRVGVHSLGVQVTDEKSENHVTLYLLIGSNISVRADMRPADQGQYGLLDIRVLNYTRSNRIVKMCDLAAVGCPNNFNAGTQTLGTNASRTVEQFISVMTAGNQFFRFLNVDGKALGCRYWV